jgi:hypothetical protein
MNDRDKEYEELIDTRSKTKGDLPSQRHVATQSRTTKRKTRQRKIAVVSVVALAVLILIIVLICKGCAGANNDNSDLSGVWHYDQYTEYEFDGEGKGCMCLDGSNHFEFTYKAEDGTLYLDFALDYVTDCQYAYTVDGDKLTLIGGEGTAEVGKVYELTKVDE